MSQNNQFIFFVWFSHTSIGTHQLPVLLKIEQGREIKVCKPFILLNNYNDFNLFTYLWKSDTSPGKVLVKENF